MRAVRRSAGCLLMPVLVGCAEDPSTRIFSGPIMGTTYRVTAVGVPPVVESGVLERGLIEAMEQVNRQMSTYLPDSELSRFNAHRGTDWFAVSGELVTVVKQALATSALSDGAFDVTVGPVVNLWGFGPDPRQTETPEAQAIARARERVGYRQLELREQGPALRKKRPDLYVDLSAIAKGYAVDRVCAFLEDHGITSFLVDIGGELRAKGHNDRGEAWRIGIETPLSGERSVHRIVRVAERAVATSGDYRNYFERDGRRFSHTIDPTTGRPITHNLASASIVAETAMQADALATTMMVLGPRRALALAEELNLAVLLIIKDNNGFLEQYTPEFAHYMVNP